MNVFTKEELKEYDGRNGSAYIAFDGKVYDVTQSFQWKDGIHQVTHLAGQDLTTELEAAPHHSDVLDKFPIIGELKDSA
ncbi:MAG: cytochrome b5 domain-containing protein [Nitrospira sp.]|nr:cytochrome b5 domain-containing protein [Nitrospira sp.]